MQTRAEHLQWCKDRTIPYVKKGDAPGALASFISDLRKHQETKAHPVMQLIPMLALAGALSTPAEVEKFINETN